MNSALLSPALLLFSLIQGPIGPDSCPVADSGFQAIQIQTGNSIEGYESVYSCFAESDFRLTRDGTLVAAHDKNLTGNCGYVPGKTLAQLRACTLGSGRHIATLGEFLELPLAAWYIDLKTSDSDDSEEVLSAVEVAISEIQRLGRDHAVLMIYNASPAVVRLIQDSGIRAALKWTPVNGKSKELIRRMVVEAAGYGFEAISVDVRRLDRETILFAEGLGVDVIASDANHLRGLWPTLMEAGLKGLITRDTELADSMAATSGRLL